MIKKYLHITFAIVGLLLLTTITLQYTTTPWGFEQFIADDGRGYAGEDYTSRYIDYLLYVIFPTSFILSTTSAFYIKRAEANWAQFTLSFFATVGCTFSFGILLAVLNFDFLHLLFTHLFNGKYAFFLRSKHHDYSGLIISFILSIPFILYLKNKLTYRDTLAFFIIFPLLLMASTFFLSKMAFPLYKMSFYSDQKLLDREFVQVYMEYLWIIFPPSTALLTTFFIYYFKKNLLRFKKLYSKKSTCSS